MDPKLIRAFLSGEFQVVLMPELEWECYGFARRLVVGAERWHQFTWVVQRQVLFETDPGPLDAKVP